MASLALSLSLPASRLDARRRAPARRGGTLALIAAVHALVIVGLLQATHRPARLHVEQPMLVSVIGDAPRTEVSPVQVPMPALVTTPVVSEVPDIRLQIDATAAPVAPSLPTPPANAVAVPVAMPVVMTTTVQQVATIPPEAIAYRVPPPLDYPRASRSLRESGRVVVRVRVDEQGLPCDVRISSSSGYPRLDAAALSAVQRARFKPYIENGVPTQGWALIPLDFKLDA